MLLHAHITKQILDSMLLNALKFIKNVNVTSNDFHHEKLENYT